MRIVYSPLCLDYNPMTTPEKPSRVIGIHEILEANGYEFVTPKPAKRSDILLAHSKKHFSKIEMADYHDIETPAIDITYPLIAAGSAIKASEISGFVLARPPGHHAGINSSEGFCYFNNIAIAILKKGLKTAILDIDAHHGQGTEEIVKGRPDIFLTSLFEAGNYPFCGFESANNIQNFPLSPGTSEGKYLDILKRALDLICGFEPELLAISAGFDTYINDSISGQNITIDGYAKIGKMINDLGINTFIVLEGGYSDKLAECCLSFLNEFK